MPINYIQPRIKRTAVHETPMYRVSHNAPACNLTELFAVIIGGSRQIETAEALMDRYHSDIRALHNASIIELTSINGVSNSTASRIKAALNIGLRLNHSGETIQRVSGPDEAANLFQDEMSLLEKEHMRVAVLNTRNHVLDIVEIYKGALDCAQIRIGEIFAPAIRRMGASIIVAHNHPSGDPNPSPEDVRVTREMVNAGKLLDIAVLDHLIIGHDNRYVSLKERGCIN